MINAGMGPSHVSKFLSGCNIPPFPSLPLEIRKRNLHPPYLMPLKHLVRGHEKKNEKNHSRQVSREALMQAGRNGDLDGITTVILVGVHVS